MDSQALLDWYSENKRDLPWRHTSNPYFIWVSEIMLQQTRVEAMIPYYEKFIQTLPTITHLANAQQDELHKLWEGLGYYSRVMNMHKAAIQCVQLYGGVLPKTYAQLLTLPGIGPYSAGAIASFAYHEQVSAVDGNVLRVYARFHAIEEDILNRHTHARITELVRQDLPQEVALFNQAIMELGACICIPNGNARCNICPIQKGCQAYAKGIVNKLPIRINKTKRTIEKWSVIIHVCNNQVLLHKRAGSGLLASLYSFEMREGHATKKEFKNVQYLGTYNHVFSHRQWNMKGFLCEHKQLFQKEGYQWVDIPALQTTYSIPSAFKKYKEALYAYSKK